jgi:hypothetical protein
MQYFCGEEYFQHSFPLERSGMTHFRHRVNGQRVRKSLGLRDWQAAQRRAREMEAEGKTSVGQPVTVKKATEDFEKDAETNIQPSTLKQYKILLKRLNAFCQQRGLVFLRRLTVVEVRDFRNSWTSYSPERLGNISRG